MKTDFLGELRTLIEAKAGSWSTEDKAMAELAAYDLTTLTRRSAMGDPVGAEEWALVRASVANLGAGAAMDGAAVMREWLGTVLAAVAKAAL